jgi:AraC-like DNA-binding protein
VQKQHQVGEKQAGLDRPKHMTETDAVRQIMAIDCCEHTIAALERVQYSHITSVTSEQNRQISQANDNINLIVIGVSRLPIRRLFISQLRRIYPAVPMLILRRENLSPTVGEECIRGEFILSDQGSIDDLEVVGNTRKILPLTLCNHILHSNHYDIIRAVISVIVEKYSDPDLDLKRVANELPLSAKKLSRILNQEVGVSFRQLLRNTRIEEAKRMLAARDYSVKEVAARVGFSDSHYFSHSFKELTGLTASEFRSHNPLHS